MSTHYDVLLLPGAGVNGFFTLGAIQCIYDMQKMGNIKKYIGTSIGSAICYLLILGLTPIEIMARIAREKPLTHFTKINLASIIKGNGAFDWNHIDEFLLNVTLEKCEQPMSFKDIYNSYGVKLICCTYNLTQQNIEYISVDNHPDLLCLSAIRMSCNVPLLFSRYCYLDNYYIDGGIIDNFSIQYAANDENVLGIYLLSSERKQTKSTIEKQSPDDVPVPELTTDTSRSEGTEDLTEYDVQSYLMEIIATPITYHIDKNITIFLKDQQTHQKQSDIIIIPTNRPCLQFTDVDTLQQLEMFSTGYQHTKEYFSESSPTPPTSAEDAADTDADAADAADAADTVETADAADVADAVETVDAGETPDAVETVDAAVADVELCQECRGEPNDNIDLDQ